MKRYHQPFWAQVAKSWTLRLANLHSLILIRVAVRSAIFLNESRDSRPFLGFSLVFGRWFIIVTTLR
jgi:hypothetical protein